MSQPIRIYLATGNNHKAEEIDAMLRSLGAPCHVLSAHEVGGMPEVDENADSFAGNARLKAEALRQQIGQDAFVLADDSGLSVEALNGAPGIFSARYAGINATDDANNALLLEKLNGLDSSQRKAAFICCFCLLGPDVDVVFNGSCEGVLAQSMKGEHGFGYDPLFIPQNFAKTFGELGAEIKNAISHRTRCCESLAHWLKQYVQHQQGTQN